MTWLFILLFVWCLCVNNVYGGFLTPGKQEKTLSISPGMPTTIEPFDERSAFAQTQLTITLSCNSPGPTFSAQVVVRSSPCDREFANLFRYDNSTFHRLLNFYFRGPISSDPKDSKNIVIPPPYKYPSIVYYKSNLIKESCLAKHDTIFFIEKNAQLQVKKVESLKEGNTKVKRQAVPIVNGTTMAPTTVSPTTTVQPDSTTLVTLPVDGVYLVMIEIEQTDKSNKFDTQNLTIEIKWKSPHGYLSAIDWPLLPFYGSMCLLYGIYAIAWFIVSLCQWKDLLRIQFWIGTVILLGMVEKAVFYAEYQTLNHTGQNVEGALQFAELVSCLKRTLSRMLIIIVSVGFGVVKPRLGATLHKVVGVGFVYFILCAIEGVNRVSKKAPEATKQKQLAALPLALLEVAIFWWILTSLVNTMRALRLRRNEAKLSLYRHFTNTLIFASLASVAFMCWQLIQHTFTECLIDWKELWVDEAFWHLLFCVILLVIMILWRPTNNNQRYAFTPLLDHEDDDDEEDTIFSEAFTTSEQMKLRGISPETRAESRKERNKDHEASIEDELRWVEENIPSSVADKFVNDSDEEAQQARFEISKMQ